MLLLLYTVIVLLTVTSAQKSAQNNTEEQTKNIENVKPLVIVARPLEESETAKSDAIPVEVKQFYTQQNYPSEVYGLTYVQPQYHHHSDTFQSRIQPQIVLYGPGGQGQPILINPGNPPGNFLIPQGGGPNVVVRGNPQLPPQPNYPIAGYPKPAHIPAIEKDAEEIPTDPARIPPLKSNVAPTQKRPAKPEKLETFTEQNPKGSDSSQFPQFSPESVSLRPGERFFILNGDQIYNYPFEENDKEPTFYPALKYTNVEPFPQQPPKYLQPFPQDSPQFLQGLEGSSGQAPITVPDLLLKNSIVSSDQKAKQVNVLKTADQYSRVGFAPIQAARLQNADYYSVDQQSPYFGQTFGRLAQGIHANRNVPRDDVVQPILVGQFRFTPDSPSPNYQFRDDFENDAIVVDASLDAPTTFEDGTRVKVEEDGIAGTDKPEGAEKEGEPGMAQAGPQSTAIAGPGGVAGSAPKATAIVGKGGLAVSSPQATAVAGTKDEEKRKPAKKGP